jgi:LmbE family N-acetylglucosaminyl deacetylase
MRILALGAHPDDIEIGCAGTILELVSDGRIASACWAVFSGSDVRAAEARAGASAVLEGVGDTEMVLGEHRDGFFPLAGVGIKEMLEDLKARPEPDLILTHRRDDRHQDHRFISDLTWQTFRNSLILEYEIPKYDGDLGQPNLYVPVSERFLERKLDILDRTFGSQVDRGWFSRETFRSIMRIRGVESRSQSGYAEAFEARKLLL